MGKLAWFKFFPGDWMKDPELRAVSSGARGLWMDMLSLMFECDRRGFLKFNNGHDVTAEYLARMTGNSTDEVSHWLQELEYSGVFSRTEDGTIFSRRMVRDERDRQGTRERVTKHRCNANVTGDVTANAVSVSVVDFDVGSLEEATQFLFLELGLAGLQNRVKCQDAIKAFVHAHKCGEKEAAQELSDSWKRYEKAEVRYKTNKIGFLEKAVWKSEDTWTQKHSELSTGGW